LARKSIRLILALAFIALVGIGVIQWFWLVRAFDLKSIQFNQGVKIALTNAAQRMLDYNHNKTKLIDPVKQLADNYFVVRVDDIMDASLLETFLKEELKRAHVFVPFEYGIYDCSTDQMVYGNFITQSPGVESPPRTDLPKWENQTYYFGVRFPSLDSTLIGQMGIWLFSSGVLVFVILFMIIAMFMILKQKRLSEIQKDFINNMTHEFKTPLSSILASVETIRFALVQEDHLSDRVSRYLGIIHTEGKRLQNQVEAVLKMANFETTRLNKREIILEDLLKHNIDAVEAQVQALGGEIRFTAPGNSLLDADALHLSNVFSNLIDNAIKYNASKPQIEIRVQRQPRGRVQVTVSDNGIGIAREQLARIFDKFYRVPTGNVHNVKGFGLGLHYVKSVVKAHGGRVFAQSVPGQGTSITLEFRLKPPGVIKK
jgi:two-component system phosphate regulon sensor histidine kinase PhoR